MTLKQRKNSKNFILYIPSGSDVVMSGDFLRNRTSAHVVVTLEGKHCKIMNVLPSYFLAFISEHMSYIWNITLLSLCQLSSLCCLPRFCPSQACWCWGKCWKDSLDAVGALLHSSQNTAVFSEASQLLLQITGSEGC